jgi:hypothetical protein
MRNVKFSALILLPLIAFLLTGSAFADHMKFLGPGGNSGGGVYTYPYNFSINGGPSTPLLCDTFDNEVVSGETWTATVSGLLSGNGLFGNNPNYRAAGLIFLDVLSGKLNATTGNWLIWGLFSSNAQSSPYFQSTLANQYLAAAVNAPDSMFAGLVLYTPVAGTQSWGGLPQEYIGRISVPEPGEVSMILGTLLLGLAGFLCRKRLGLKLAISTSR